MERKIQKMVIVVSCAVLLGLMGLCARLEQSLIRSEAPDLSDRDTTVQTTAPLTDSTETEDPTQDITEPQQTWEEVPVFTAPPAADPTVPPTETTQPLATTPPPEATEPEQTAPDTSLPQTPGLGDTELPPV